MFENKQIERVWAIKNIRNGENINTIHVKHFFNNLPDEKQEILKKAEYRNMLMTSENKLEHVYVNILENGIYFKLEGCRSAFNIFCNFDGEIKNKPKNSRIIKKYTCREY
jgi:hypothetical protein